MPTIKNTDFYLANVHLKGFKSIEDIKVDLENGLNILIGKNLSGKSNFLDGLHQVLISYDTQNVDYEYAELGFVNATDNTIVVRSERLPPKKVDPKEESGDEIKVHEKIFLNDKKIIDNLVDDEKKEITFDNRKISLHNKRARRSNLRGFQIYSYPIYVKFNVPDNKMLFVNQPGTIKIRKEDFRWEWQRREALSFFAQLFFDIEFQNSENEINDVYEVDFWKKLDINEAIKNQLKKYSPIKDIRFNENIAIHKDKDEKFVTIENLKIEFKIDTKWVPWSHLSDGARRLFYLISEVSYSSRGVVFVEEPELGVHPHQFHQIMLYLQEESETKQIIISTHSPQALNLLDENEFHRILLTTYDPKQGTKIRHLTKPEIAKARKYIKDVGFLSDYWMLSDLES